MENLVQRNPKATDGTIFGLLTECEERVKRGEENGSCLEEVVKRQEEFGMTREQIGCVLQLGICMIYGPFKKIAI